MSDTQGETILLVEDEPAVRQLFSQALMRAGYRVHEARNGNEAMKLFDQYGGVGRPAAHRHADGRSWGAPSSRGSSAPAARR